MRTLRLARIAAEAEVLRLRRQVQRTIVRVAILVIGLGFLAMAAAFAHVAAWFALRWGAGIAPWATALIVGGGDLVVALIFLLLAARSRPGRVELEAMRVRQQALENVAGGFALATFLTPALRYGIRMMMRKDR